MNALAADNEIEIMFSLKGFTGFFFLFFNLNAHRTSHYIGNALDLNVSSSIVVKSFNNCFSLHSALTLWKKHEYLRRENSTPLGMSTTSTNSSYSTSWRRDIDWNDYNGACLLGVRLVLLRHKNAPTTDLSLQTNYCPFAAIFMTCPSVTHRFPVVVEV